MTREEAKVMLCNIGRKLTDEKEKSAIWVAIRAIDTCCSEGFKVTD